MIQNLKVTFKPLFIALCTCLLFCSHAAMASYISGTNTSACGQTHTFQYQYGFQYTVQSITWKVYLPNTPVQTIFGGTSKSIYLGTNAGNAVIEVIAQLSYTLNNQVYTTYDFAVKYVFVSDGQVAMPGSISGSASLCSGASSTYSIAAVSGASGYLWEVPVGWVINGGFQSFQSGATSVTVTAPASGNGSGQIKVTALGSGCTASSAVRTRTISYGAPTPALTGVSAAIDGTLVTYSVTNWSQFSSFNWYIPLSWSTISTSNNGAQITVAVGPFSGLMEVIASSSCGTSSASLYVNVYADECPPFERCPIDELRAGEATALTAKDLMLYPNPVSTVTRLQLPPGQHIRALVIRNQMQQEMMHLYPETNETALDLSTLPAGVYFLQVDNGQQKVTTRLLKQ